MDSKEVSKGLTKTQISMIKLDIKLNDDNIKILEKRNRDCASALSKGVMPNIKPYYLKFV